MTEDSFILFDDFNRFLNQDEFIHAKNRYVESLHDNLYQFKNESVFHLISEVKREACVIGPYKNISLFEALNRIATDLVLLAGAHELFVNGKGEIKVHRAKLRMGITHGWDCEFETNFGIIYGEAFNASESFGKYKMYQGINKLIDHFNDGRAGAAFVFANSDIEGLLSTYRHQKELASPWIKIHRIYCDTSTFHRLATK